MTEFIQNCANFGLFLTLGAYLLSVALSKRFSSPLTNPILLSVVIIIPVLVLCKVDYTTYYDSAKLISALLTPATVSLAIPLYRQMALLKKHFKAILLGILSGVLTSGITILGLSALFGLSHTDFVTLLPKSVTTAIGMSLSEELGGVAAVTVTAILLTGILGNVLAVWLCKVFRITDPIAKGLSVGTSSHALGTARAIRMGEIEGAMSGLSIAVAGLMTVVLAPLFAALL